MSAKKMIALQWNSRSVRHKKSDLFYLINKHHPSVLAISETWLKPDSIFRVPGYSCFRDDRNDGHGGALLLVNRSIPYNRLNLPGFSDNLNAVAVSVFNISILSIYIPHPNVACIPELNLILASLPSPILVLGDFNCHHPMWGSYKTDSFALLLLDVLDDFNLCVLNDGRSTRRTSPLQNCNSVVDLSLCSPSLASRLNWSVLSDSCGSDHFPILVSFPDTTIPTSSITPLLKFQTLKADWMQFIKFCELTSPSLPSIGPFSIEVAYSEFTSMLLDAAKVSIPPKKLSSGLLSSPPWWDSDCSDMIRKRKSAEKRYTNSWSEVDYLQYKHIAAKTRRTLSQKKKFGWQSFCESLSPCSSSSIVWKKVRKFRGSFEDSSPQSNCDSWFDGFADKLAPPWVPSQEESLPVASFSSSSHDSLLSSYIDKPFSLEELNLVLDSLKDSTPGFDGIPYSFIIKSGDLSKLYLLALFNYYFESGAPPDCWRSQVIIPILKPGKDASCPSSYRPIALSSCLGKIMEHLIKARLEWFLESKGTFPKNQFGFRKGMSTLDSLSILVTDIRLALTKQESLIGVFLDISSAYDSVLLPVLKQKMLDLHIPMRFVRFISNFLSTRTILFRCNGEVLPASRTIWKGLPQGSVLSPLLFNIYTHDLHNSVSQLCEVLQFADDLVIYSSDKSISSCSARLSSALNYLNVWLSDHGLSISPSKSNVVVFSRKRCIPSISISVDNIVIPVCSDVKFLGVTLDSRLSGQSHLYKIIKKCEKNHNILRSVSGVWWGSHPYTQKLLYNAIIRSHFDYGSFLLEPCNSRALGTLDRLQYKSLRVVIGAMRSSPTNALLVECVDPPLRIRRQYLADRFLYRAASFSGHPLFPKLQALSALVDSNNYWTHKDIPCLLKSYLKLTKLPSPLHQHVLSPLFESPYESLVFSPQIILYFGIDKDCPCANSMLNEKLAKDWSDWSILYTDSSKLSVSSSVGSAVWFPKFKIILNFSCPPLTSVFTGESIAILEAVLYIESHNLDKSLIFSDSRSCLEAILSNPFRSKVKFPVIFKIRNALFRCKNKGLEVVLAWIPGHCGIIGNETVDFLAKDAIVNGSNSHRVIYSQDLLAQTLPDLFSEWDKQLQISKLCKGKHYFAIQQTIPDKPWFFRYRAASKAVTSTICRMRLGHACYPLFLCKLRVRDNSLCECGLDDGSMEHILFSCSNLQCSLYEILPPDIPRPCDLKYLLSLVSTPFISILSSFLRSNKIKL